MIYAFQSKTSSPLDICLSKQNTKLSLASKTNLGEKGFQSVKIYRILSWSVFPSKHLKVYASSCLQLSNPMLESCVSFQDPSA